MGDITFDPMDAEFIANPYPTYHRLRAEEPVHHNPLGFWVLTRYEDVLMVLRDPRFAKASSARPLPRAWWRCCGLTSSGSSTGSSSVWRSRAPWT